MHLTQQHAPTKEYVLNITYWLVKHTILQSKPLQAFDIQSEDFSLFINSHHVLTKARGSTGTRSHALQTKKDVVQCATLEKNYTISKKLEITV